MEGNSTVIIIIILLICCCCVSLIAAGGSWYENWTCPLGIGYSCSSSSNITSTSTSTPLQTLLSSATQIQIPEVDPTTLSGSFLISPPNLTGSNVFTFMFDISLSSAWTSNALCWEYNLFDHSDFMALDLSGMNSNGEKYSIAIHYYQTLVTDPDNDWFVYQSQKLTADGSWHRVIATFNGALPVTYLDGEPDLSYSSWQLRTSLGIKWPSSGSWKWDSLAVAETGCTTGKSLAGACKIKNFYWWSDYSISTAELKLLNNM